MPERAPSEAVLQAAAVVEERALALWGGSAADFGVGVTVSRSRWTVRSVASMKTLPLGSQNRPTFQQVEVVRRLMSAGALSVSGGGGVREEWDGTRTLIG